MALIGFLLALLLSFYLLARIVDGYFVEALDKIANKLKMSSDAAGATLMAVGSSAPELFVAVFAVFRPGDHTAIGVGNIVGSALFNILAITGAAAIVRKSVIAWQPVVRDLFFYAVAILMLLWVFHDGEVDLLDAIIFISIYIVYVVVVVFWRKILKYKDPNEEIIHVEEKKEEKKTGIIGKITQPIDFVVNLLFPPAKHYYAIFTISIVFIAGLSWVLVESAVEIAAILNIPEAIIAVTILAAGTSVPDLMSSMIVSKQGRGGMAISNAVGSNIFDILIGLGLPFLLMILLSGNSISLEVKGIENSVIFLLASVVALFGLFIINKWEAGKKMGGFLILLYLGYVVWAILNVG